MRGAVLIAATLAACSLDPDADLAAADLRVRIAAVDPQADTVVAAIVAGDGARDELATSADPSGLTLYFVRAPDDARRLRVETRAAGVTVQCWERALAAGETKVEAHLDDPAAACASETPRTLDAGADRDAGRDTRRDAATERGPKCPKENNEHAQGRPAGCEDAGRD